MTKVLFIDVDGPLIPARALFLPSNLKPTWQNQWAFDPCAVGMLNFLAWAVPDLVGVISSHRVGYGVPIEYDGYSTFDRAFWEKLFTDNGLRIPLHPRWITPRQIERRPKVEEISDWLKLHPEVTQFAVIEDDFNGNGTKPSPEQVEKFHIVATNYDQGLSYSCFLSLAQKFGLQLAKLNHLYQVNAATVGRTK